MPFKIPQKHLGDWAADIVKDCQASQQFRIAQGKSFRSYYYSGADGDVPAINNRVRRHINRLAALLFSPVDARFNIEFDITDGEPWMTRGRAAASHLNRSMVHSGADNLFQEGVKAGLIYGSSFIKNLWNYQGLDPYLVLPGALGVYREDVDGFDRQEAFVHTMWLTMGQFKLSISGHPEEEQIIREVETHYSADTDGENTEDYMHQIVIGGVNPVTTTPPPATNNGQVSIVGGPYSVLSQNVAAKLIRVEELWVQDEERGDWTTIRYVEPKIVIEGKLKRRNLSGVKGEQPFKQICPNSTPGYFWGESEIPAIQSLQDLLNTRLQSINKIVGLKSRPPKAFIGFSGMTREKYRAAMAEGGFISEENPTAKIEDLSPEMPEDALEQVNQIIGWMDDVAGITPALQGQGDGGVRAGSHAQTLVRSSAPGIMDRALVVERQWAEEGDFAFKLLQEKDAKIYVSDKKEKFLLSQMPEDYKVTVDSHSASPAFRQDTLQLAFALAKASAIGPEELIMLTHPPLEDTLIARAREKAEAQAKMVQAHPELLTKGKKV